MRDYELDGYMGVGAYQQTLHTVRLFMCILHVNGGNKGQKSKHTNSHRVTGFFEYAYRSFPQNL